jgi:hypothetical protein
MSGLKYNGMIESIRMRWAGHVAHMGRKGMHMGFWWETKGKRLVGSCRYRWDDNIKMDHRDMG